MRVCVSFLTFGSCCGIQSEVSWPLLSQTRSTPSTSTTRGLFCLKSLKLEWNSDSKSLPSQIKEGKETAVTESTSNITETWIVLKIFQTQLLVRLWERWFLLGFFQLPQPANKELEQVFHRACWLAGSGRVGDDITDEVSPRFGSSSEGAC